MEYQLRKRRKDARNWIGKELAHGTVLREMGMHNSHSHWEVQCTHCDETHVLTVKQMDADVWTNKCKNFTAHNSRGFENHRDAALRRDYGITLAQYREMHINQGAKCAICGVHQSRLTKSLSVDHCHETLNVRGLLCYNCNKALGHFHDSIEKLCNAICYLAPSPAR